MGKQIRIHSKKVLSKMIIKFDHLTYVTDEGHYDFVHNRMGQNGYSLKFKEINLRNIQPKIPFLLLENTHHSMYYYEADRGLPIEIVVYNRLRPGFPTVDYTYNNRDFTLKTQNNSKLCALLKALGVQMNNDSSCRLNGLFDKAPINAVLQVETTVEPVLDTEGFCCPTLLVDSYERVKNGIESGGGFCTEMEELNVNGRQLKVFFAIAGSTIIELISSK